MSLSPSSIKFWNSLPLPLQDKKKVKKLSKEFEKRKLNGLLQNNIYKLWEVHKVNRRALLTSTYTIINSHHFERNKRWNFSRNNLNVKNIYEDQFNSFKKKLYKYFLFNIIIQSMIIDFTKYMFIKFNQENLYELKRMEINCSLYLCLYYYHSNLYYMSPISYNEKWRHFRTLWTKYKNFRKNVFLKCKKALKINE